jgi:serine/threonine protein kinase
MLMQKNKIVHNDLFDRNIIFDKKLDLPIVIDFGLSYQISRFYNIDGTKLNIKMIHQFLFDFRSDSYQHNIDKRFISFFSYNTNDYYNTKVTKLNQKNDLNQQLLDIFIDDAYNSILGSSSLVNIFEKHELETYRLALQDFYGKFLNKKMYSTSSSIIKELLPIVIKFSDLYSLSIEYIKIYMKLLEPHDKNSIFKNLFLQLFKKTLFPNTQYRLDCKQLRNIIEFFITNLNEFNFNSFDSNYNKFITDFDNLLIKNDIKKENFFFPEFAYIDFEKILIPENIKIFQSYNLSYYKCQYI